MPDSLTRPGWARLCVALLFFVNGAVFAGWGSRVPDIAAALDMGPGALAVAALGLSVGLHRVPRVLAVRSSRNRSATARHWFGRRSPSPKMARP